MIKYILFLAKPVNENRYKNTFEELDPIGSGSFGTVFKVKSRINGKIYSIKKLSLDGK